MIILNNWLKTVEIIIKLNQLVIKLCQYILNLDSMNIKYKLVITYPSSFGNYTFSTFFSHIRLARLEHRICCFSSFIWYSEVANKSSGFLIITLGQTPCWYPCLVSYVFKTSSAKVLKTPAWKQNNVYRRSLLRKVTFLRIETMPCMHSVNNLVTGCFSSVSIDAPY